MTDGRPLRRDPFPYSPDFLQNGVLLQPLLSPRETPLGPDARPAKRGSALPPPARPVKMRGGAEAGAMSPNAWLVPFVVGFWLLLWLWVKAGNWRDGREWSAGPSFIPIIPFIPAAMIGAGWLVNRSVPPWGTWAVVGVHLGYIAVAILRRPRPG
jgi:hypothetical protein